MNFYYYSGRPVFSKVYDIGRLYKIGQQKKEFTKSVILTKIIGTKTVVHCTVFYFIQ